MKGLGVKEAIEYLRRHFDDRFFDGMFDARSAQKKAIDALEKQIPKKPDLEGDGYDENGNLIYDTGYCPNCRHIFEVYYDATRHCPVCGQALDWSDVEC